MTLATALISFPFVAQSAAECVPIPEPGYGIYPHWHRDRWYARVERLAYEQGLLVVALLREYAAAHGGAYPQRVSELQAFWPDGLPLVNAFTCVQFQPIDGMAASPGEIGYVPITSDDGVYYAATVTVWGKTSLIGQFVVPSELADE